MCNVALDGKKAGRNRCGEEEEDGCRDMRKNVKGVELDTR